MLLLGFLLAKASRQKGRQCQHPSFTFRLSLFSDTGGFIFTSDSQSTFAGTITYHKHEEFYQPSSPENKNLFLFVSLNLYVKTSVHKTNGQ